VRYQTLQEWLAWLESCHPVEIDLGLARISAVAKTLKLDFANVPVITVGGTNGKGSCVAILNAVLRAAGYRVGCFTSPHFIRYNERIVVNDRVASDSQLIESFDRIDRARGDLSLTYFEFNALAAFDIFEHADLDVVILEVGLGGRLDAVNTLDADIGIVTSIALDHQDWLGDDLAAIGQEKAGIYRRNKPALCGDEKAPETVAAYANKIGAEFYQAGTHFSTESHKGSWSWSGYDGNGASVTLNHLPVSDLPEASLAVAIQALQFLSLPIPETAYQAMGKIVLTGRFQRVTLGESEVILDVAHNPAAAEHLSKKLAEYPVSGKTYAIFATMADKDVEGVVSALANSIDHWLVCSIADNARALSLESLVETIKKLSSKCCEEFSAPGQAFFQIKDRLQAGDRLLVFGSFFTVAGVLSELSKQELIHE